MLGSNVTEQKANIQRLEMTIEKMKDSKQAADTKQQQTLDQHKVISQYLCTRHMCVQCCYLRMYVTYLFELYLKASFHQ